MRYWRGRYHLPLSRWSRRQRPPAACSDGCGDPSLARASGASVSLFMLALKRRMCLFLLRRRWRNQRAAAGGKAMAFSAGVSPAGVATSGCPSSMARIRRSELARYIAQRGRFSLIMLRRLTPGVLEAQALVFSVGVSVDVRISSTSGSVSHVPSVAFAPGGSAKLPPRRRHAGQ